ncbi:MAG: hypothetical protein JWQ96_1714 [Segetibacter sp.]|nr:hypothetical protein [Segetibacter sp.]
MRFGCFTKYALQTDEAFLILNHAPKPLFYYLIAERGNMALYWA